MSRTRWLIVGPACPRTRSWNDHRSDHCAEGRRCPHSRPVHLTRVVPGKTYGPHGYRQFVINGVPVVITPGGAAGSVPRASSLPDEHLKAFAGELREAVIAESPERVQTVLFDWQQIAEVRTGTRAT